jgi:hypothetical protein
LYGRLGGSHGRSRQVQKISPPPPSRDSIHGPPSPKRVDIPTAISRPTMITNIVTYTSKNIMPVPSRLRTPPLLLLLCAPSIKGRLTALCPINQGTANRRRHKVTARAGGLQPAGCTLCPVRQSCVPWAAVLTGPFWSKEYIRSGS